MSDPGKLPSTGEHDKYGVEMFYASYLMQRKFMKTISFMIVRYADIKRKENGPTPLMNIMEKCLKSM